MGINGRNGAGRTARTTRRTPVEPLLPTELPPLAPDAAGTPEPLAPPDGHGQPDGHGHPDGHEDGHGPAGEAAAEEAQQPTGWRARLRLLRPSGTDLGVLAVYVLGALYVLQRLVGNPGGRVQDNVPDQTLFEWVLAFGSRVVTDQLYPFISDRLNAPTGINMMANTSVLGIGLPLTPVTLLFGSAVAYVVFSALTLAGTAAAWYYVLSRHIVRSRAAAAVGGGLAGFAPAMISHSYGHPNIAAQFLVPFIFWRTIKLSEPHRWLRNGVALALLIIWQTFINEETLLVTAIGLLVFVVSYALMRPSVVRGHGLPFVAGALVAAVLAGAALAYPLHIEFNGHEHGMSANSSGPAPYAADLLAFPGFSHDSLAGHHATLKLAQNVAEQSSFFGWPLLLLLLGSLVLMARSRAFWSATFVALVLSALSLGGRINIDGRATTVPGPWTLLGNLPLFRQVVPTRIAVAVAPVLAVMLALAFDRVLALTPRRPFSPLRLLWMGAMIAALVPIVPVPLTVRDRPPVPAFISDGTWQRYVDDRHTLVAVPSASVGNLEAMRWAAISRVGFAIPGGYYLSPEGGFGAPPRPTSTLLDWVAATGGRATITDKEIDAAATDLRFWRAAVVVIVPGSQTDAVKRTVTDLLEFKPSFVDGVWLWDVRGKLG